MTTPAHQHDEKGILPKIGHQIAHIYDWIAGPAMSEHDRIQRDIAESEPYRRIGPSGL